MGKYDQFEEGGIGKAPRGAPAREAEGGGRKAGGGSAAIGCVRRVAGPGRCCGDARAGIRTPLAVYQTRASIQVPYLQHATQGRRSGHPHARVCTGGGRTEAIKARPTRRRSALESAGGGQAEAGGGQAAASLSGVRLEIILQHVMMERASERGSTRGSGTRGHARERERGGEDRESKGGKERGMKGGGGGPGGG